MELVFLLLFICAGATGLKSPPIVDLPSGKVEGRIKTTVTGKEFYAFDGIPYARPPIGKYRFKEPIPPKPWNGIWKATTEHRCLQNTHFPVSPENPVEGLEDCLYVNVFTPSLNQNKKLDVIVFIHGGAFMFGTGHKYGPEILLNRNVIYVSLNYRLGPFGFLSTEDDVVPGNNGLKDQQLALKWIKDNIIYFGGNPESITITGMSAGGASVHFHTISPGSKGLFQKAISQSGCLLNPWVILKNPLEQSEKLAAAVGCETTNTKVMVDCLRKRPGKQLAEAIKVLQPYLYNPYSPFGVVIDAWATTPVLPEHPLITLKNGRITDVPWIASLVTEEGLYPAADFYPEEELDAISKNWNLYMPAILHYNATVDPTIRDEVSEAIREQYLSNQPLTQSNYKQLVDLIGDRLFKVDVDKCIRLHSAGIKSPVYSYIFGYRGRHSASEFRTGTTANVGVSHADDTYYVLKTGVDTQSTEKDRKVSGIMLDIFTTFAEKGKPTLKQIQWSPASKNVEDDIVYLSIKSDKNLNIETAESLGNKEFWDSLPFLENEKVVQQHDEL